MRIVCDTNVLVSGILFGGHARRILQMASHGRISNVISGDILQELETVLSRPEFKLTVDQVAGILTLFRDTFELVHPTIRVRVVLVDPADDRILEAALAAGAEVIVSGDHHLRALSSWQGIRILSPAELAEEIQR